MIRPAIFGDIPRLQALLAEAHGKSRYRQTVAFDPKAAEILLAQGVQQNTGKHYGATLLLVSETAPRQIEGLFYGFMDRVYHVGDKLKAIDVFWYCTDASPVEDRFGLFDRYLEWVASVPDVVAIQSARTDLMGDDPTRLDAFFERKGFRRSGVVYEKEISA